VHCAQTAEDKQQDFFCIRQHHVSDKSYYNLAYMGKQLPPKILPESDTPHPVYLSVADFDGKMQPNS